jgi:microcystin-dependent protein
MVRRFIGRIQVLSILLIMCAFRAGAAVVPGFSDQLKDHRGVLGDVNALLNDPPIGTVVAYAGKWPMKDDGKPDEINGWCLCLGQRVQSSEYPDLWRAVGDLYGPATAADFCLPALQGTFLRGADETHAVDVDSASSRFAFPIANTSAIDKRTKRNGVGSWQSDSTALPKSASFKTDNTGDHIHDAGDGFDRLVQKYTQQNASTGSLDTKGPAEEPGLQDTREMRKTGSHEHTIVGGGDVETRPVNVAMNWIIKARHP